MSTLTIDAFLSELDEILRAKDGSKLQGYLVIEPPFTNVYRAMVLELRESFPMSKHDELEVKCERLLLENDEGEAGGSWPAFISFLVQYFAFIRDVNVNHLMETHDMLKALLKSAPYYVHLELTQTLLIMYQSMCPCAE